MDVVRVFTSKLKELAGKDYGAYQSLIGVYSYPDFDLEIVTIPKDPYAPPHTGVCLLRIDHRYTDIPRDSFAAGRAGIAYRDFLARKFHRKSAEIAGRRRGTGYSGIITIDKPGQAILDRNSVVFTSTGFEVRFFLGFPAKGRNIDSRTAESMLIRELPDIVSEAFASMDRDSVMRHLHSFEDTESLREIVCSKGLAAFIADGSILPRLSGESDEPLASDESIPFRSPDSLRITVELPHTGSVTGLGIPSGVTLITGGGYHGKSTLLHAIETGIYSRIPGDGRELCVADPGSVKIRAYSGRPVSSLDISSFIGTLPFDKDTSDFSTSNASGSTSQASTIVESLEAGARILLMDEDTCAANFMIRDRKMQELIRTEDEPIIPFIDRVRSLYEERGISSVIVLGGIGDYFEVADTVIQMIRYQPEDVTSDARRIVAESAAGRLTEYGDSIRNTGSRYIVPSSIDPLNEHGKLSVYARGLDRINFGRTVIDLTDAEQLVELSQVKAIARSIVLLREIADYPISVRTLLDRCMEFIGKHGLDGISERITGHYSAFRSIELAFALNRLRSLNISREK